MDEASKIYHEARERRAGGPLDTEQRKAELREKVLLAIGSWYAQLHHVVPLAMRAEAAAISGETEGNVGSYRAEFLGSEFAARVESYVLVTLDEAERPVFRSMLPPDLHVQPVEDGELLLFVSIFPDANLHSISATTQAAGMAAGVYGIDERATITLTEDGVLAILKEATTKAVTPPK